MAEIAEKVKFWEEQQQINDLLIPRVVQATKTVETVAGQVTALTERVVAQQAELAEATKRVRRLERWCLAASVVAVVACVAAVGASLLATGVL
ncbi:MAG: hypothetical protein AAGA48_29945 [Myxococcota bacterium]